MLRRSHYVEMLRRAIKRSPITALIGPRQCGKTTLAGMMSGSGPVTRFDLESPTDQLRLQNPELVLGSLAGLVVLDEIQFMPSLFGVLRVLADRPRSRTRFLILGSASPELIRGASESLAGRVEFVELTGFTLTETGEQSLNRLWVRGGFPRSMLARSEGNSFAWREGFIQTFLQRDIPQLGISLPAPAVRRFWTMLAHYHGQTWNASELARSMALSDKTVRSWLDILTGTFMIRQLLPWHENIDKRQVKSPKIYFRDSGLLHCLLGLPDRHTLLGHPRVGASWEGFAIEQVLAALDSPEAYFWATQGQAELDLMFMRVGRRYGVEVKFDETPKVTRSMHTAIAELHLDHLWIVYPGEHEYPVDKRITVWPLAKIAHLSDAIERTGRTYTVPRSPA